MRPATAPIAVQPTRAHLAIGAVSTAVFWALAAVIGGFVGAEAVRHPLWVPSQVLHTAGSLLVMVGIPALRPAQFGPGWVRAESLAQIGTALFAADGLIALSVFPTLASVSPESLEATGAMNAGVMLATYIAVSATNMVGWIALAGLSLKLGPTTRKPTVTVLTGAILFNLPPGPVPLIVLAAGGVLWSMGLLWWLRSANQIRP